MPNILAHSHVTSAVKGRESPDFVLGSTLPDFQGMYMASSEHAFVVIKHGGEIEDGVNFHQTTDSVFDSQEENLEITKPLFADLMEVGVEERAAKFTAAFAGHLMLDAALLDDGPALADYLALKREVLSNRTSLARGMFSQQFAQFVIKFFESNKVVDYADSIEVAKIAQRRLASRAKSSERKIDDEQLPAVSSVLSHHAERAGELGMAALAKTIEQLRKPVRA